MAALVFAPAAAAAPNEDAEPSRATALTARHLDPFREAPEGSNLPQEEPLPPEPTIPPVTVPESVEGQIRAAFPDAPIMYWVALNESGLDPTESNPSGAKGLYQIVGITWRGYGCQGDVFNAADNIRCARKIYDARGLKDWEWSRNEGFDGGWGKYL